MNWKTQENRLSELELQHNPPVMYALNSAPDFAERVAEAGRRGVLLIPVVDPFARPLTFGC